MKKKLKIAIYSGAIPSTTFVEHLINGIAEHHEVLLFGRGNKNRRYSSQNIRIHHTPESHLANFSLSFLRLIALFFKNPKYLLKLFKETKKYKGLSLQYRFFTKALPIIVHKPDIFHIQWAKSLREYIFLKTEFKIPVVLSLLGSHINYSPVASATLAESYRKKFPKVDLFHAVSKAIGHEAGKYGAPTEKIEVIHTIIPKIFLEKYKPYKKRQHGSFKLVSIGRSHWIKGYEYAIRAMGQLKQLNFDFSYTIIGIEKPKEELLYLIKEYDLERQVRLIPSIPQKDLINSLHGYDVMLLSSLNEGIANVILEAMAIGLPVISTDCGGMGEVITDKVNGFLVPIRNPDAIVEKVLKIYNMNELEINLLTQKANLEIKEEFDEDRNIELLVKLYEGIIDPSN